MTADQEEPDGPVGPAPEPKWCVVANVVRRRLKADEVMPGTRHFSGGTKVYLHSGYWGMGAESVVVVGQARRSHRWIRVALDTRFLENWRAQLVHRPAPLRQLADDEVQGDEQVARDRAELLARVSGQQRLRLVERTPRECLDLVASCPGPTLTVSTHGRGAATTAFVLYDGADPVAGLVADLRVYPGTGPGAGLMSWKTVWVARERRETLADLLFAVQRRHRGVEQQWVDDLARLLREAYTREPDATDPD